MDERPEEDNEAGPDQHVGKARGSGPRAGSRGARGGAHAFIPATFRGPRATKARGKIKETLTDSSFDSDPVENKFNKR